MQIKINKILSHPIENEKLRITNLRHLEKMDLPEGSKAEKYVRSWNNYATAIIMTLFLVHPNITAQTFAMMNCKVSFTFNFFFIVFYCLFLF